MTTLFEQLVGSWELVSYSVTAADAPVSYPLGEDATGYIMYTPDGYMSAHMMRAGRPEFASGDVRGGTEAEMSAAAAGYLAYAGPFYVDEQAKTLRHHMTVSLFPNWLGNTQERIPVIDGDKLVLSFAQRGADGELVTPRMEWRRARPNV